MDYSSDYRLERNDMNIRIVLACIAIILISEGCANASLFQWLHGKPWKFMEDAGGVAVESASRKPQGNVSLSVRCDISGLTTITKKPVTSHSALSVKSIKKHVEEQKIYISVKTGLISKHETCVCSEVDLGDIPAGQYEVIYYGSDREKHSLGFVTVPPR